MLTASAAGMLQTQSVLLLALLALCSLSVTGNAADQSQPLRLAIDPILDDTTASHGSYRVTAVNDSTWPVTLRLQLAPSDSYRSTQLLQQPVSIQPGHAIDLYRVDRDAPVNLEQSLKPYLQSISGSLGTYPDKAYQLPCACSNECAVSQTGEGSSHQGWQRHAIDFYLPEGSPVHAVSEGIVLEVRDQSNQTCTSKSAECDALTNSVTLLTSTGALLEYSHLAHEGSLVRVGDRVASGDLIAVSGNTGYSFGPHLHLAQLGVDQELRRQTFPMRFDHLDGSGTLTAGRMYQRTDCAQ